MNDHGQEPITPGDGWDRIGVLDPAGRRSLWIRVTTSPSDDMPDDMTDDMTVMIELRSGREGDDAYACVTPANPQWRELEDVLTSAPIAEEELTKT